MCEKYRVNINTWNSRFTRLLQADVPVREEHRLFGSGISSRYLADTKKRYWYKNSQDTGVPEFSILFMIDGSGSMAGSRRNQAVIPSIILHEVLKKQNVPHAIVEHRGIYNSLRVEHRVLIDFSGREEEKYNLMTLNAFSGTREGLSLYWAEKYILKHTPHSNRLMIVLSDGVPSHVIKGSGTYEPPVSLRDTAEAAKKIIRRGTDIIAVALDDGGSSCYDSLCNIYPSVIQCTDLTRLTGQLLGIISRCLQ